MAFILNDRVKQTSTTVGTISMVVDGSLTGFVTFTAGIGDTNSTYYTIVGEDVASEWEVGIGTYTSSGTSLSRDTVIGSSNGGSKTDFSAGTKVVFCTMPAEKIAYKDSSGNAVNSVSYKQEGTNFTDSLIVGHSTTGSLTSALANTFVGIDTGEDISQGDQNTAIGSSALKNITSGGYNTALGTSSLGAVTTQNYNVGVGRTSLANVEADYNIGIGTNAGDNITSGSGNVIIGHYVDPASATADHQFKIGGNNGSSTVTWISGDSSGNITVPGTVTADSQQLVGAGFAIAMSIAL